MSGSVIQAIGRVEFEEGLLIVNQLKAQNDLQRVCTTPKILPRAVYKPRFVQGQTEFQSAVVRVAAWFWSRHQV